MRNILASVFCLLMISCGETTDSGMDKNSSVIDSLKINIDSLESINLDLQDQLTSIKITEAPKNLPFEARFIQEQLRQNTGLIKMESVLGGTMYFSDIKILNQKWIMAKYEDGHVQGASLIRYDAVGDSTIKFKVLDSIEHY